LTFTQQLQHIQQKCNSLLCIGLDPDVAKLPSFLRSAKNPQYEFNRRIIEATYDLVCAYKLNIAFYESAGMKGWEAMERTLELIPKNIITIGDGKRGDIGNSSEHQARAMFNVWKFDAATVNPYMGVDSVEPFIQHPEKGAFILALTSNRGSNDFQYLKLKGKPLFEHVVAKAKMWNVKKNIGLVVGATHPRELKKIRSLVPNMPLLIPGIGAQSGDLEASVRFGCDKKGELAVINVGRAIIFASSGKDFAKAARQIARKYRDEMNGNRDKYFGKKY
jgi:orotidine-5'-phosphate decarboxylase